MSDMGNAVPISVFHLFGFPEVIIAVPVKAVDSLFSEIAMNGTRDHLRILGRLGLS